jgi:AcrR family transcriptional regulator
MKNAAWYEEEVMAQEKLSRRDRDKLRHRQEMLGTALTLFSEKGYHNVSMQEIAETAEFAIGTLYKFFKNKEDLYKCLIFEQADRFHLALWKALAETDDEIEKLRNYGTIQPYFARARRDHCERD